MVIWNIDHEKGGGLVAGLIAGAVFAIPMVALWHARERFSLETPQRVEAER